MANLILSWLWRYSAALACGLFVGGICVPAVHHLIYCNTYPFVHGWPVCLESSASLAAFSITMLLRDPTASALGIYIGLVEFMLHSGVAEYPVASAIGLAIQGLLPAALGSAIAFGVVCRMKQPSIAMNPPN